MTDLDLFAKDVGDAGPVVCAGGRTQWDVGGVPDPTARELTAPAGIVSYVPAEMTVRVRAGTTVAELDAALAEGGQMVPLDPIVPDRATVGGVLSVGHSGIRRLRFGPVRDCLLEATFVSAEGKLVKAGGPVVKNVSGYDLCRLLVGSLGTLGFIGEVVLRAQPRPMARRWLSGPVDPFSLRQRLFRPSSILWDGATTWVLLEGHPADLDAEVQAAGNGMIEVDGPPTVPLCRSSLRPSDLPGLTGQFLAEVGVGTVHRSAPDNEPRPEVDASAVDLNRKLRAAFDPTGRLNPGRMVP